MFSLGSSSTVVWGVEVWSELGLSVEDAGVVGATGGWVLGTWALWLEGIEAEGAGGG